MLLALVLLLVLGPTHVGVRTAEADTPQPPAPVDVVRSDIAPLVERGFLVEIGGAWYVDGPAVSRAARALGDTDASAIGYSRDRFTHWRDPDRNGCDARNDILARDLVDVVFRDGSDCVVERGTLLDPYTGSTIAFQRGQATSSAVQIDHIVPLAAAWTGGANTWDDAAREAFANDPANLQAVDGASNGAKGQMLPGEWMPPNAAFACTYLAQVTSVLVTYELELTAFDRDAITDRADSCVLPTTAIPPETSSSTATATPPATAGPTASTSPAAVPVSDVPDLDPTRAFGERALLVAIAALLGAAVVCGTAYALVRR